MAVNHAPLRYRGSIPRRPTMEEKTPEQEWEALGEWLSLDYFVDRDRPETASERNARKAREVEERRGKRRPVTHG